MLLEWDPGRCSVEGCSGAPASHYRLDSGAKDFLLSVCAQCDPDIRDNIPVYCLLEPLSEQELAVAAIMSS